VDPSGKAWAPDKKRQSKLARGWPSGALMGGQARRSGSVGGLFARCIAKNTVLRPSDGLCDFGEVVSQVVQMASMI